MKENSILIVDQSRADSDVYRMILAGAGYRCVCANTIDDARLLIQNVDFAVVDLSFPKEELQSFLGECLPTGNYMGTLHEDELCKLDDFQFYKGGVIIDKPTWAEVLLEQLHESIGAYRSYQQSIDPSLVP